MTRDSVVRSMRAAVYVIPTTYDGEPEPESDGTASWDSTGVLVIELEAGGSSGLGYAYTSPSAIGVVREVLAPIVMGADANATTELFWTMAQAVRNLGWRGIAAGALSAVDIALHDAKARELDVSLLDLMGRARDRVMAYGSGGFTGYTSDQLTHQLEGWLSWASVPSR